MPVRFVDFTSHPWRRAAQPYRIGLMTDAHFGNSSLVERQRLMLQELDRLIPAYIVLMGDNVDTSRAEHYAVLHDVLKDVQAPILPICGNHELFPYSDPEAVCLDRFRHAFSLDHHYYHRVLPPYHFIFLGIEVRDHSRPNTTKDTGISPDQLRWFRQLLAEHPRMPTVVISHAPLVGTVQNSDLFPMAQSAELVDILDASPQICLWVSGHTHLPDAHHGHPLRTLVSDNQGHTFLHVPPVADYYVHLVRGQKRFFRLPQLQTRMLECHPDHIAVRTIDCLSGESWISGYVVPGKGLVAAAG